MSRSAMAMNHDDSLVLGIESSCDETAASVVRGGRVALSNVIASQHELHAEYRGVVPEIASRAHAERILPVIQAALAEAGIGPRDLHAVAIGNRPGLIGSLLVGVAAGKALAWSLSIPIVGVDHVQAHMYAGFLSRASGDASPAPTIDGTPAIASAFPALGLVVSGGHTALYRLESPTHVTKLGSTRDDAVGEAYDKCAALLELPFPGGPIVDKLAQAGNADRFDLPVSRLERESLDFSFSGLKTAVLYTLRGVPSHNGRGGTPAMDRTDQNIRDLCAAFQHACSRAITLKLQRAIEQNPDCGTLLAGGGVTANSLLRTRLLELCKASGVRLVIPAMEFCLDNGAMIAGLGHHTLAARAWAGDALSISASASSAPSAAPLRG
ncbi:MAG: tRNA (adenosine(37)-N6)-threonylcarbamoyltransferase complex transferase subunit TsaD [Phycisphaerales bacterium]|nr:tRNA (adenosine(37)-N6)-threonylcarbamoyltransferase complex transferase subunit TsaD [Phycisphaerales bacterium]